MGKPNALRQTAGMRPNKSEVNLMMCLMLNEYNCNVSSVYAFLCGSFFPIIL